MSKSELPMLLSSSLCMASQPSEESPFTLYISAAELLEGLAQKAFHPQESHPVDYLLPMFHILDLLDAKAINAEIKKYTIYKIEGRASTQPLDEESSAIILDRDSLSYSTFPLLKPYQRQVMEMMDWLEQNCICPHCVEKALPAFNFTSTFTQCQINWKKEKNDALAELESQPTIH